MIARNHERRVFLCVLIAGLPAAVISLVCLWTGEARPKVQWTLTALMVGFYLGFAGAARTPVPESCTMRIPRAEGERSQPGLCVACVRPVPLLNGGKAWRAVICCKSA